MRSLTKGYRVQGIGHREHPVPSRGFTLIELAVTVSIFIIMTALVVYRYGTFSQGTLLTNLAYDVALSIRTAQTYGLSVKGTDPAAGQNFTGAYGVHFDSTTGNGCTPQSTTDATKFIIFTDADKNGVYDCAEAVASTYNVKQGAKISSICVGTGQSCTISPAPVIDISFRRPDPAAIICHLNICTYTYAQITVQSGDGSSARTVTVRNNGQISVGN